MVLNRRQAITWTSEDPFYWRIHAALGGDEIDRAVTRTRGPFAISYKTNSSQILQRCRVEGTGLVFELPQSLWNYADVSAAPLPVKFQSDMGSLTPNIAGSKLYEILR